VLVDDPQSLGAADRPPRVVTLRGEPYPVLLPSLRDPRLHLASVITTLHVFGQVWFDFELSIPQILGAILTSALLEVVITARTKRVLAWPASAMLTGNGVAFLLRVNGTEHGDWWSTRGLWIFMLTAGISLLSKYLVRFRGRHVFNPSNFGLVLCFLVLGSGRVEPLDFWWAPWGLPLALAYVVIVVGGVAITRRTRMVGAAVAFWLAFAGALGVITLAGHCITASWHIGLLCDGEFWRIVVTSPEILVFLFFMITDPKTSPGGRGARMAYGAAVGVLAAALAAPQTTEFATKVAVLAALVVVCAFRPVFERVHAPVVAWLRPVRLAGTAAGAALLVVALVVASAPARRDRFEVHSHNVGRVVARPAVHVDLDALPRIEVGSQREFAGALTDQDVRDIVRDFVGDLEITARAVRRSDPDLAATAGDKQWLARVRDDIAESASGDRVVVDRYEFDALEVAVLKLRASQALPEIDVRVRGTLRRETYERGADRPVDVEVVTPYRRVFVVEALGGHYLITDDRAR
jgi:hypothetical protein